MSPQEDPIEARARAEASARAAQRALAEGRLDDTLEPLAVALSHSPNRASWVATLDEVLSRGQPPSSLVPIKSDDPRGLAPWRVAFHARARWLEGETAEALALLVQVASVSPRVPFLRWGVEWIEDDPAPLFALEPEGVVQTVLSPLLSVLPGWPIPLSESDPARATLEALVDLFEMLRAAHEDHPPFWLGAASALRRLGRLEEAVKISGRIAERNEDRHTCAAHATALRDVDAFDEAAEWFERALEYAPEDPDLRLELADTLLDAGRLDEAIKAYEATLEIRPDHPWARPSLYYARYRRHRHPPDRAALLAWFDRHPRNPRARRLADAIETPALYINRLPRPADATAHMVDQVVARVRSRPQAMQGARVQVTVSALESPSVQIAWKMQMAALKAKVDLDLRVTAIQNPDPRKPRGPVDFTVWNYEGVVPRPAFPAPRGESAESVMMAIAEIAHRPYHLDIWASMASRLAEGPSIASLGHEVMEVLLGTMLHPPPMPPDRTAVDWVFRVQVVAALTIGALGRARDGGQAGRRALKALALGPVDWITGAAIVALTALTRADHAERGEVESLFQLLAGKVSDAGYTPYELPLACCWLALGEHEHARQVQLTHWVKATLSEARQLVG